MYLVHGSVISIESPKINEIAKNMELNKIRIQECFQKNQQQILTEITKRQAPKKSAPAD